MGIFDKIKNALFEVEYVEEEEKPKKEKVKDKEKSNDIEEDKPIAKKIVLPGKKEEKVEEIKEEDLKDEDFEIRPKDENVKTDTSSFKYMDDDDFKVDPEPIVDEKIVESNYEDEKDSSFSSPKVDNDYVREYDSYRNSVEIENSKPYGMDPSYNVSIKKYGSYESRDEKTYFKPSPIISPIYGILDKNYKKEDVVAKKSSLSYSNKSNLNLDEVRNKAYGGGEISTEPVIQHTFEVEESENLLVDLNDEKEKPEVKEITVGDAVEYFDDLGLEYNVDYVDASNKKKKQGDLAEEIKDNLNDGEAKLTPELLEDEKPIPAPVEVKEETKEEVNNGGSPTIEVKDETKDNSVLDDDDNLFDLIDSMYKDNN